MKKAAKIFSALVLALTMVLSVQAENAKAAGNVVVHVQNGIGWENVNIYIWGNDGELAGAWPGTAMTEEGDGWYTATFEATDLLNFVFCVDADGDGTAEAQTGDLNDVDPSSGEIWIKLDGGEEAENALGAAVSGSAVLLDGKPDDYKAGEKTDSEEESKEEESKEEQKETQPETAEAPQGTEEAPKTGDSIPVAAVFVMALAGSAYIISRKTSAENH